MKKMTALLLSGVLLLTLLLGVMSGCSVRADEEHQKSIRIVAEIFPEYDWASELLAGIESEVSLTLLLGNGVDLHSYQPSVDDMTKISSCDLFLYVGGESDGWARDAAQNATNENQIALNLMDILGENAKEEEIVEGMQGEHEEHDSEEEVEYDEHVWLSLDNAAVFAEAIKDALVTIDPEHAEQYEDNCKAYKGKLSGLDERYREVVSAAETKTLLFGDRFPFRYLTDDYGLSYYAAFAGCSAETGVSFETITFLADRIDEENLSCVLTIDGSDGKIAQTVADTAKKKNVQILTLDSMQSVTEQEMKDGVSYLSIMEDNLKVLEMALSE